jgi:hypothetical protein
MQPAQKFHTIPFVASLLICSIACTSSADTPQIRVGIQAKIENGNDAQIVSALSREIRKLDGISVTDSQPALKISCVVIKSDMHNNSPERLQKPRRYSMLLCEQSPRVKGRARLPRARARVANCTRERVFLIGG